MREAGSRPSRHSKCIQSGFEVAVGLELVCCKSWKWFACWDRRFGMRAGCKAIENECSKPWLVLLGAAKRPGIKKGQGLELAKG